MFGFLSALLARQKIEPRLRGRRRQWLLRRVYLDIIDHLLSAIIPWQAEQAAEAEAALKADFAGTLVGNRMPERIFWEQLLLHHEL